MEKNVVMIVVDALSSWYIQEMGEESSFFTTLSKKSFCVEDMYSTAPFTVGAIQGLWRSQRPLDSGSYKIKNGKPNAPFYQLFYEQGYQVYLGGMPAIYGDYSFADSGIYWSNMEKNLCNISIRATLFRIFWFALKASFTLYEEQRIRKSDIKILENHIENFFSHWEDKMDANYLIDEKKAFKKNKEMYVMELLKYKEEHSLYKNADNSLCEDDRNRKMAEINQSMKLKPTELESHVNTLISLYNRRNYIAMNKKRNISDIKIEREIESNLAGSDNRCIQSNNSAITHILADQLTPTIDEELNMFLEWIDSNKTKKPYFSYIQVLDFHYQERIIGRSLRNNPKEYERKLAEIADSIERMPNNCRMSVLKYLSFKHIEDSLKQFFKQIEEKGLYKDTLFVITADHGITNYMYPAIQKERWVYNDILFHVPFYMFGENVECKKVQGLKQSSDILPTLASCCNVNTEGQQYIGSNLLEKTNVSESEYISTEYINGFFNINGADIKLAIRSKLYSLTYTMRLTQFFKAGKVTAIFDLVKDPDEIDNLAERLGEANYCESLIKFLSILEKRWYELLQYYAIEGAEKGFFENSIITEIMKKDNMHIWNLNQKIKRETKESLERDTNDKVILFGASQIAKHYLEHNCKSQIYEIWDNSKQKNGQFFWGHKIVLPHKLSCKESKDISIVITNRYGVEMALQLEKMGIEEFSIYSA